MKKRKFIPYRRKTEGRTNYKKRLILLKSGKLRLVVRKSLRGVIAQLIEYKVNGDVTKVTVTSKQLKTYGWKGYGRNTPAAYLVGLLLGKKAQEKQIKEAVLDLGLYQSRQGTILFAVLKGAVDSGLNISHNSKIFPSDERIAGKHISEDVAKNFEETKNNIAKVK
ncbi:MAG: 50S ribosomal protein L18 [Nanoarchaeota archaeon]|nr:50S ribosomal protein L18 [Nanoarchaeota archaeon]